MAEVLNQGYKRGKASKKIRTDKKDEIKDISDAAGKKGLYGMLGSTIGQIALTGLTGGAINPITLALLTAGTDYVSTKAGHLAAGDMPDDLEYFQDESDEALEQVTGGTLTDSVMSGVTAGVGQKLKLMKEASSAAELANTANMPEIKKGIDMTSNLDILHTKGLEEGADFTAEGFLDVTGDAIINMDDIYASTGPITKAQTAKDFYKPSKFLSLGNEGGTKSPIMDALSFMKNLHTNRKKV